MRPRKRILLIDADETRRGILAYALDVHRYEVHQCETVGEVLPMLWVVEIDVILGRWPLPAKEFGTLWRSTETPCLAIIGPKDILSDDPIDGIYQFPPITSPTTEDLLNQIKTLTARKHGPKKGYKPIRGFNKLTAA